MLLKSEPIELFVEDYKLGGLVYEKIRRQTLNSLRFIPSEGYNKSFLFMGSGKGVVREKDFPDEFPLYMHYKTTQNETFKSFIPHWTCRKEKQPVHLKLPNFEPLK